MFRLPNVRYWLRWHWLNFFSQSVQILYSERQSIAWKKMVSHIHTDIKRQEAVYIQRKRFLMQTQRGSYISAQAESLQYSVQQVLRAIDLDGNSDKTEFTCLN